jgi:hypothetical protein
MRKLADHPPALAPDPPAASEARTAGRRVAPSPRKKRGVEDR